MRTLDRPRDLTEVETALYLAQLPLTLGPEILTRLTGLLQTFKVVPT